MNIKKHDKKIIALLSALLLWYYVNSISVVEKEMTGQIRYSHMPAELMALNLPQKIRYYIKTDKYYKENINPSEIYFEVSLKNAQAGANTLPLEIRTGGSLPGYVKIEVPQDHIKVFLERRIQKKVTVKTLINNTLHPSYRVDSTSVVPVEVVVEGAESYLADLREITTEELILKEPGIHNLRVRIETIDGITRILPPQVRVRVNVVPNLLSQRVYLPVKIQGESADLKVKKFSPHRILTRISGTYERLKKLDFQDLFYYIDLEKLKTPGRHKVDLSPHIPQDLEWEKGEERGEVELILKGEEE